MVYFMSYDPGTCFVGVLMMCGKRYQGEDTHETRSISHVLWKHVFPGLLHMERHKDASKRRTQE
jgi:hypothetical protein